MSVALPLKQKHIRHLGGTRSHGVLPGVLADMHNVVAQQRQGRNAVATGSQQDVAQRRGLNKVATPGATKS